VSSITEPGAVLGESKSNNDSEEAAICSGGHSCHANPARPQYNHLQVSSIILAPAYGAAAALAHQTLGFDITSESSALSNPPTLFPSTNPSTRPRTGVITQAAVLPSFCRTSSRGWLCNPQLPPHVHCWQAANAFAHRSSVIGKTPMSSPRRPSIGAPSSEGGGLTSRLAVDNSSTTRLSAATPIPAHCAALREEIDSIHPLRRSSSWSTAWLRALVVASLPSMPILKPADDDDEATTLTSERPTDEEEAEEATTLQ